MLTIITKPVRISFTFGFFFVLGISTLRGNTLGGWSLVFCIFHELGHLFTMRVLGESVSEITFYGAGIKIISNGVEGLSPIKQAAVYLSGPAVNLAFSLILRGELGLINLFLGGFNLLPISYFDGGRLAELVFTDKRGVLRALSFGSYALIAALIVCAAVFSGAGFKPSALMSFVFISMSYVLDA